MRTAVIAVSVSLLAAGCVMSPQMMQQMQAMNENYSISPSFDLTQTWRVAALPPTSGAGGNVQNLYDVVGLELMKVRNLSLVDRSQVDRILQEQELGYSGVVDPGTAARLGRLMGASAVAITSVTQLKHDDFFSDSPEQRDAQLFLKIISVETAEVLYYSQGQASSFNGPDDALHGAISVAVGPLKRKAGGM